jgi:hypothetical protein
LQSVVSWEAWIARFNNDSLLLLEQPIAGILNGVEKSGIIIISIGLEKIFKLLIDNFYE